jgi:hypothetical protein
MTTANTEQESNNRLFAWNTKATPGKPERLLGRLRHGYAGVINALGRGYGEPHRLIRLWA